MKIPIPISAATMRRLAGGAAGLVLPPVCLVCGQRGESQFDCCAGCERELPRLAGNCRRCSLELPQGMSLCGRCARRAPGFDRTWAGFAYRGQIERLVKRFKFHHDLAAGRVLAGLLARRLDHLAPPRPDLMVPVPMHWRRRLMRGFNQTEMLCADLSGWLAGLPWHDMLDRTRATPAQSVLPASRRGGNVRGAFRVSGRLPGVRHVALVDDVMTTGATLDECARALKRGGVQRVDVWVVARA